MGQQPDQLRCSAEHSRKRGDEGNGVYAGDVQPPGNRGALRFFPLPAPHKPPQDRGQGPTDQRKRQGPGEAADVVPGQPGAGGKQPLKQTSHTGSADQHEDKEEYKDHQPPHRGHSRR